ncbi:C40 family peptidase [Streptomyces sp. NPDC049881]|uniref:C40 family peptidase n=1 Tax=Streptomyces sp. NPDC049881 TaxID=3155778 RepID=UPI003429522B
MKKSAGVLVGLVASGPLLLAVPVLAVTAASPSANCPGEAVQNVDSDAVAELVTSVLAGTGTTTQSVTGLEGPTEQIPNAVTITATGVELGMPPRGQVVALATALQESGLRNLPYGDRDSVGLYQQRPSQGWGSVEQILDPVYAATRFYNALADVAGWESMTVTQAAQAVQRSAFPDAYAKWEPLATALQQAIEPMLSQRGDADEAEGGSGDDCPVSAEDGSEFGPIPDGALPTGYVLPADAPNEARTAIRWALGQLGTPYQWGGSCTDSHGPDPMARCDCSSLTQMSYRAAGVTLSRTTYTQVAEGTAVPVADVEPGDLIFTEGTAAVPEHVGMYIGSGLVVNAPRTGEVVRVETLASWKPQVLAVRRIL